MTASFQSPLLYTLTASVDLCLRIGLDEKLDEEIEGRVNDFHYYHRKSKTDMQKQAIKRGDRILTEKPFIYCLNSKYREQRCDHCLAITGKLRKCSNCRYVYYCDRACQTQAWLLHKSECPMLSKANGHTIPNSARLLIRLIIRLNNGGDQERGYYSESNYRKFRDLMSHHKEIKNDDKRLEHLESLYVVLGNLMEDITLLPNQMELLSLYGRLIINGFNILDGEMNSIATGIYLGVSIIDHNCQPNAVVTFEGTTLHVHAITDIDCLDWSKIFISYIDQLNTTELRRQDLKNNYYFWCVCSICVNADASAEQLAAKCPNKLCSAAISIEQDQCNECSTKITQPYRDLYEEVIELTKSHLQLMKDVAYLDACSFCLKRQKAILHSLNVWYIKTLDAAFDAAIQMRKWQTAIQYGQQLLPGLRKYIGEWNPLLGIIYMRLAKIQWKESHLLDCIENFRQAEKILTVTHGRDHSILQKELQPMLQMAINEYHIK